MDLKQMLLNMGIEIVEKEKKQESNSLAY